ncbi:MAG: hypothetical protein A2W80_11415 [Candidatus Riflebacteria bacterium GWC2_50_8]|nr:MAG: hypothetical protein A2W80_11415 [Candidatus Riflebacteria bacterium GWC2_50_8]
MKKTLLLLFVFLLGSCVSSFAEIAFDFDNSNSLDDKDLAIFIGWKQLINAGVLSSQITNDMVLQVANPILSSVTAVSRLPALVKDNLSNEATDVLDDQDIAFFIAYNQLIFAGVTNFSFSNVEAVAANLIAPTANLGKFPGTPIGSSSFSTTITGIVADP